MNKKYFNLSFIVFLLIYSVLGNSSLEINWMVKSNPSQRKDFAYSVCENSNYIFIVGGENDNNQARVKKRLKENGDLVKYWNFNFTIFNDLFTDCIVVNDKLYIIGLTGPTWYYVALDLDLNVIKLVRGRTSQLEPNLIIFHDNYLYIAGPVKDYSGTVWIVEKRDLNLKLIKEYISNLNDITIGVNPLTENIWIIGYKKDEYKLKIEILDKDLNYLKTINTEKFSNSYNLITFDKNGNGYIATISGNLIKLDKNGNLVKNPGEKITLGGRFIIGKILFVNDYLYLTGHVVTMEGVVNHVILILDEEFQEVNRLTMGINVLTFGDKGKIVYDERNLYVTGNNYKNNEDSEWIIYSVKITSLFTQATTLINNSASNFQEWIFQALIISSITILILIILLIIKIKKLKENYKII